MRPKGLRITLVPFPIDGQMAGRATVHLAHAFEVDVVDDVLRDGLMHDQARRNKVEHRSVEQVVVDEVDLQVDQPILQPRCLGRDLTNGVVRIGHAARERTAQTTHLVALRRHPLDLEAHLDPPLVHGIDSRPIRGSLLGVLSLDFLERVPRNVVIRLLEVVSLGRQKEIGIDHGQLVVVLVNLLLVGRQRLLGRRALGAQLLETLRVQAFPRRLQVELRHLRLQGHEASLIALPLAIEIVPHHPDDRREQKDAGRGEDDVEEIDVVGVSDAFLVSHDPRERTKC